MHFGFLARRRPQRSHEQVRQGILEPDPNPRIRSWSDKEIFPRGHPDYSQGPVTDEHRVNPWREYLCGLGVQPTLRGTRLDEG